MFHFVDRKVFKQTFMMKISEQIKRFMEILKKLSLIYKSRCDLNYTRYSILVQENESLYFASYFRTSKKGPDKALGKVKKGYVQPTNV